MLSATGITKSYHVEDTSIPVLKDISVDIGDGEFVAIVGRSGSGKSTLLNVLSTLVRPDEGELIYDDKKLSDLPDSRLNRIRKSDFSIIFQFHHLLPYLSALENTLLPFMNSMRPVPVKTVEHAKRCLERVGIGEKAGRLPGRLSGGEQQRVAIARALVKSSRVLFADEPTGSLDKTTGRGIIELLTDLHREGLAVVMVTHEPAYAACADRIIQLEDGIIV